ncbi:MAG TPA: glycine/sarcosine/betaine reductase complex component C subunit beta [bacterium]|nr:glycine/sarcosine/betaine reductase complex component C subunit beta [bacterium]
MGGPGARPVVRAAQFVLAHVPGLVLSGSKPRRELARDGDVRGRVCERLRSCEDATAYPPHQVMLGTIPPAALDAIPRPWHLHPMPAARPEGPAGVLIDDVTFYGWLARGDAARLVRLHEAFAPRVAGLLHGARVATAGDDEWARALREGAEPFYYDRDRPAGFVLPGHDQDESLSGAVLLENLAAKVTGALALRRLVERSGAAEPIEFLIGSGEEAVGDRYQRGGGNLAKAMGELAGVTTVGGVDVKAFCAGPLHALLLAGSLVASGMYRRVAVVAGCSLAKLGMKMLGHLAAGYPILEDVLAGVAIDVACDDGRSPLLRLDMAAVQRIDVGSAPHRVLDALAAAPLRSRDLRLVDVDRFAVELHNPDITEPAGSGNVPAQNYQLLAALAATAGEITRDQMPGFIREHGMPGFSPTQGHIASAVPYLPHAIAALREGAAKRVQFIAKGSLFLGRMTAMGDGASFVLESQAS